MDIPEAVRTRIDIREYADEPVADGIKREVLDGARLASSGRNTQHWRFVLVDGEADLTELGERSPTGGWVADAAFAVAVLTNPEWDFHMIDAGKAITHMQLVAWDHGVGSCMFTTEAEAVRDFLGVPDELELTAVVGFGYPPREVKGIKNRKSLDEVVSHGTFGTPLELDE